MEYLKNITIAESGKIRSNILQHFLTAMLFVNAISITMTIGMLDNGFQYPGNLAIAISVFSAAMAVFLSFLLNKYLDSINYKFRQIDSKRLESIVKIAKRFFAPFMLSVVADTGVALFGVFIFIMAFLRPS